MRRRTPLTAAGSLQMALRNAAIAIRRLKLEEEVAGIAAVEGFTAENVCTGQGLCRPDKTAQNSGCQTRVEVAA
jgi:hypothetical protein